MNQAYIAIENLLGNCDPELEHCVEVARAEPDKGIIPRCTFWEQGTGDLHAVIVGENPGKANLVERRRIIAAWNESRDRKEAFDAWKEIYKEYYKHYPFYGPIEVLLRELCINGDRLWTDVCKCQKDKTNRISIDTQGHCASRFLFEELKSFKETHESYIVVSVGAVARNFLHDKQSEGSVWKDLIPKLAAFDHPSQGLLMRYLDSAEQLKMIFDEFRGSNEPFQKFLLATPTAQV
jgi:hypothetical protein